MPAASSTSDHKSILDRLNSINNNNFLIPVLNNLVAQYADRQPILFTRTCDMSQFCHDDPHACTIEECKEWEACTIKMPWRRPGDNQTHRFSGTTTFQYSLLTLECNITSDSSILPGMSFGVATEFYMGACIRSPGRNPNALHYSSTHSSSGYELWEGGPWRTVSMTIDLTANVVRFKVNGKSVVVDGKLGVIDDLQMYRPVIFLTDANTDIDIDITSH